MIAALVSPGSGLCPASGPAARGAAPPCRGSGLTERPYRHRKRQLRVGCEFWHGTRLPHHQDGRRPGRQHAVAPAGDPLAQAQLHLGALKAISAAASRMACGSAAALVVRPPEAVDCHYPVQPSRPARLAVLIGDPVRERIYRSPCQRLY
jgi:hypothetical protein